MGPQRSEELNSQRQPGQRQAGQEGDCQRLQRAAGPAEVARSAQQQQGDPDNGRHRGDEQHLFAGQQLQAGSDAQQHAGSQRSVCPPDGVHDKAEQQRHGRRQNYAQMPCSGGDERR